MIPLRIHVVYWHTNDEGETYFMVDWKFKSNREKRKKRKKKFITNMLFIEFSTTLPRDSTSKNRYHLDGRVDLPNIVASPKVCEIYYKKYSDTNVISHFFQEGIKLESVI